MQPPSLVIEPVVAYDSGSCRDHVGSEYRRGQTYYQQNFAASGAAESSAADVVLVVDESGSIDMEVLWIREVPAVYATYSHLYKYKQCP